MKKFFIPTLLAVLSYTPAMAGANSSNGVGNPATEYCKKVGGQDIIFNSSIGQMGLCQFGSAMISSWTLYYNSAAKVDPQPQAAAVFLAHPPFEMPSHSSNGVGMPNPAAVYCEQVGGTLSLITDNVGNQTGLCRFDDNSSIEDWTLFRGPTEGDGAILAALLVR